MARVSGHGWLGGQGEEQRARKPAAVTELLCALERIRGEATILAGGAAEAIQNRSYDPYRRFCEKRAEHAALVSILRGRIGAKPKEASWPTAVDHEERALVALSIQACLKFAFALSANPLMPIGARETFIHELATLREQRERLSPVKAEEGVGALLDELETALMILEEIVDRSPALEEL